MRWWMLLAVVGVLGCQHQAEVPAAPPPSEDLSTWTVPEVVQPPAAAQTPSPAEEKPTTAEEVYTFTPGTPYAVTVPVGWPLDILLEPGEQVRNIVGGERAPTPASAPPAQDAQAPPTADARRWEVREGAEGTGDTVRGHVFVAASEPGMRTGVIITTTRRTYYLTCQSAKSSPIRVLRWRYPAKASEPTKETGAPGLFPDPTRPARYHVGYQLTAAQRPPDWLPRSIVDDGKKLYIVYPEVTLFGSVPVIRMVGPNGPQLVNARQYLNVVIVDQLIARAELRVGIGEQAETVTITRGALRTIECPGDAACPVWPQAAQTLAGRKP